ncbi:hypothetical protein J6590_102040, partial [Homalodisca vitripennis]
GVQDYMGRPLNQVPAGVVAVCEESPALMSCSCRRRSLLTLTLCLSEVCGSSRPQCPPISHSHSILRQSESGRGRLT